MEIVAYKRLSLFYDNDWGDWCLQYMPIIRDILKNFCPQKANILDLACGTGVLINQLALMGYDTTGIDLSEEMIEVAKSKNIPGANFIVQNMCSFILDEKYDLVTCTFDALNYLTSKVQLMKCFKCVAESLNKNGIFLFDVNTEKLFLYYHYGIINREVNKQKFVQKRSFNIKNKRALTKFYFSDGSVETHVQRAYNLNDLIRPAQKAGFEFLNVYSDFNLKTYTSESLHCICILIKR